MFYKALQYHTVVYCKALQYHTVVYCKALQYHTLVYCRALQHHTLVYCKALQYHTLVYHKALQYHTLVYCNTENAQFSTAVFTQLPIQIALSNKSDAWWRREQKCKCKSEGLTSDVSQLNQTQPTGPSFYIPVNRWVCWVNHAVNTWPSPIKVLTGPNVAEPAWASQATNHSASPPPQTIGPDSVEETYRNVIDWTVNTLKALGQDFFFNIMQVFVTWLTKCQVEEPPKNGDNKKQKMLSIVCSCWPSILTMKLGF